MIETLAIRNFKSIRQLDVACKQVNLFIGEPNTGKSNILEAIAFLSMLGHANINNGESNLDQYVRFDEFQDLFFDNLVDEKIIINADGNQHFSVEIALAGDRFQLDSTFRAGDKTTTAGLAFNYSGEAVPCRGESKGQDKTDEMIWSDFRELSLFKYYKFKKYNAFPGVFSGYLLPPGGANLFGLAMGSKRVKEIMTTLVKDFGLNYMLRPREKKIEVIKQRGDLIISYPYISTSDTLQRVIFFSVAMASNRDSVLVFEEPESFAFPYYTKYLGERIAFDDSNQYFISTHNPYLLLAVLEKKPKNAVNVFVTYQEDFETRIKALTAEEISRLMDSDPFFNLRKFIDGE